MMIYENHIHIISTAYAKPYNHHVQVTTAVECIEKVAKKVKQKIQWIFQD